MKKYGFNLRNLIFGILLFLIGLFFCFGNTELLTKIIFIVIGILIIASNILPLIDSIKKKLYFNLATHLIEVIFGILFIFVHNKAISIIIGIIFIIIPIINIIISNDKRETLNYYLPSLIFGILVLVLGPSLIGHVLFLILGIVSIIFGIITILSSFYKQEIIE